MVFPTLDIHMEFRRLVLVVQFCCKTSITLIVFHTLTKREFPKEWFMQKVVELTAFLSSLIQCLT